jgi:hypothetical protein
MSSDPELLQTPEGDGLLWISSYAGRRAADGHHPRMLQLRGHPRGFIDLTPHQAHALADWLLAGGYGAAGRAHVAELGQFVCPRCMKVSHNTDDLRKGWCGRCHDWTADPR